MQNLSEQYEHMVFREDELIRNIQTCEEILSLLLDYIYKQNHDGRGNTMSEIIQSIHQMEGKLRGDLLQTRIEKTILSCQMKKYVPPSVHG